VSHYWKKIFCHTNPEQSTAHGVLLQEPLLWHHINYHHYLIFLFILLQRPWQSTQSCCSPWKRFTVHQHLQCVRTRGAIWWLQKVWHWSRECSRCHTLLHSSEIGLCWGRRCLVPTV